MELMRVCMGVMMDGAAPPSAGVSALLTASLAACPLECTLPTAPRAARLEVCSHDVSQTTVSQYWGADRELYKSWPLVVDDC